MFAVVFLSGFDYNWNILKKFSGYTKYGISRNFVIFGNTLFRAEAQAGGRTDGRTDRHYVLLQMRLELL